METVLAELSRLTVAHPVAQAIGLAALVATCLSYLARETRRIALRQGVASCLWTAHLLMLGAWTGGLMTLLGVARGAVYSQRGVSGWASARIWPWAFGALCVTGAAWAGMAQGEGPKLLLSCGAQCIGCYALWTSNVSRSRRLLVLACILWLSYDALSGSLPGVVCEAASLGSLVVAMSGTTMGKHAGVIAVFADLHYTAESGRLKGEVLRWAVGEAARRGATAIVCAGDMVGSGRKAEAEAVAAILAESALPVSLTPGNAELRTPEESAKTLAILSGAPTPKGVELVDSSRVWPSAATGQGQGGSLVVTHEPPPSLPSSACRPDALVVAGHMHRDTEVPGLSTVRGLDPDKAQGGPPALAIFGRSSNGVWRRAGNVAFPGVAPEEWAPSFRRCFLDDLGISTMDDPFGGLGFAIRERVPCLELRAFTWRPGTFDALLAKVREWRASGGRVLSLHLPELGFASGVVQGVDAVREACRDALVLGCDRVTLHVPNIPLDEWEDARSPMCDAYAEALAPFAGSGVAVGVENMHVTDADRADWKHRRFGYTPDECAKQMSLLRGIPGLQVGFHLDIGHARNNAPFSTQYPVGAWYELLGSEVNGMHLHQIDQAPNGTFRNHRPLLGFFDPLVSLSSLVMARQRGILPRAPMFLEIRDGLGPVSWSALHASAEGAVMSPTHPQSS